MLIMKQLLFFLLLTIIFIGCKSTNSSKKSVNIQMIPPGQAHNFILQQEDNHNFSIIDVRTPDEFRSGHIEGAINIDWLDESKRPQLIDATKQRVVLLYCRSGNRSLAAAKYIKNQGALSIFNIDGGIIEWNQTIGSLIPDPKNEIISPVD